jgi:hypothetical protein
MGDRAEAVRIRNEGDPDVAVEGTGAAVEIFFRRFPKKCWEGAVV